MESVTLCMIERTIKLMKTQEEIQARTLRQLEKLENRENRFQELIVDLHYDLAAILQENRDFHKTNTTLHTLKLNVSREVLKEIRSGKVQQFQPAQTMETLSSLGKITSVKNVQSVSKGRQSIKTNKIVQDSAAVQNNKDPGAQPKNQSIALCKKLSMQTNISTSPPSTDLQKSNCSSHLLVSFDRFRIPSLYDYDKLLPQISLWTGQLFSDLSENTYQRLKSKQLNKDQMKIFFSSNLILNSVLFMGYVTENYPYIWKPRRNDIVEVYNTQSKNALKYLMTKYTVKKRETADHSCDHLMKEFTWMHHPDHDSLACTKIRFDFNKDKQYSFKIKEVLNAYIKMTKRYYNRFQREISKVTTIDLTPPQDYPCIAVTDMQGNCQPSFLGPYHNNDVSTFLPQAPLVSNRNMSKSTRFADRQNKQSQPPLPATLSNIKVLKGLVGMKIKPETGLYTMDELKENGIKIKTAEVLRVIIKWIEDLEKKVTDVSAFTVERDTPFANKIVGGQPVELTQPLRELLRDKIKESVEKLQARNQELGDVQAALTHLYTCIKKNKDTFQFIPQNQVYVGLATYILSDPVSKITTGYLESLIHCLLEAEQNFNACSGCDPISLISFGIYDLLRAKFTGTREQITAVYSNLCDSKCFKVIRIKNRLDTINRDFLLNLRLVNTPLICQLQLGMTFQQEKGKKETKSELFENFSHFLYQLDRAKYGPLIEAVIINNHESPTISYFQNALKELKVKTLDFEVTLNKQGNTLSVDSYIPIRSDAPFSCSNCWKFIYPSSSFLKSFQQEIVNKGKAKAKKICGQCIVQRLSSENKKKYLLGDIGEVFQEIKVNQISKLKDGVKKFVCLVLNGSKKNVKILEVQGSIGGVTELVQTFVQQDIVCQIYELQDLSISQAFKLKDEVVLTCTPVKSLTPSDILANSQIHVTDLNRTSYLTVPLKSRKLVLDVWCSSAAQKFSKQARINNIRAVMQQLKQETQSQRNIKSRIISFIQSNTIIIPNRKLTSIDIFVSKNLQILNVSSNLISCLDLQGYNLPQLQELDVSNNQLLTLDLKGCKFDRLNSLKAQFNMIEYFDIDEELKELRELDLGGNRLEGVCLFEGVGLPQLEIVNLDNNYLREIDFINTRLPELKTLNLKHNYMVAISGYSCLEALEFLDLSINFMQEADFSDGLKSLKRLDLSANRLYKVSGLQLENIKEINLCFNYLQSFNLMELMNTKIQKLNLAYNRITQINYEHGMIKSLKELMLEKNRITDFKWDKSIRASPFIRMADRRSMQEYTDEQILGMFNWQFNQSQPDQISSIVKYLSQVQTQRDFSITRTSYSDTPPYIRYDATDTTLIKDLLVTYTMIPEQNPASSTNTMKQVEYRISSLNPSAATRLRRIIEENL